MRDEPNKGQLENTISPDENVPSALSIHDNATKSNGSNNFDVVDDAIAALKSPLEHRKHVEKEFQKDIGYFKVSDILYMYQEIADSEM